MFFCSSNSFSSQLLGSCRFAAKLLWPTAYTSPPARVCAVKPAHGNDAAIFACFLFCTAPFPRKAQHNRDIKIFYHYQEGFSINFHIFIHPKNTRVRFLCGSGCAFLQKANKKGALARTNVRAKLPFAGIVCSDPAGTNFFASNPFCIKGISG